MITVYTVAYNEEVILPFMIKWYRDRFSDCKIVVYDNYSTDRTEQIALEANCEVIKYDTNNQLSDSKYLEIKNNCWKDAKTDWVLICDADEFLDINEHQLSKENCSIIQSEGWNMINTEDNPQLLLKDIKWGSRAKQYDKYFLFNKNLIKEINYSVGCHFANPKGEIKFSEKKYLLYHFRAIDENYIVNKNLSFAKRLSKENLKNNWGFHYLESEETIRNNYKVFQDKTNLKKIIDENSNLFNN
jgi:hypothetical protein